VVCILMLGLCVMVAFLAYRYYKLGDTRAFLWCLLVEAILLLVGSIPFRLFGEEVLRRHRLLRNTKPPSSNRIGSPFDLPTQ